MAYCEQGLMNKIAKFGTRGVRIGDMRAGIAHGSGFSSIGIGSPRNGGLMATISDTALHNGALGAGLGALAGVTREWLKDPERRKHYLKSILVGLMAGGAAGVGATMIGDLPDYVKRVSSKVKA